MVGEVGHGRLPALRAERGSSLTELLVTAAISLLVIAAAGTTLALAVGAWNGQSKRTDAFDQARQAFLDMTRELRQATEITRLSGQVLEAKLAVGEGQDAPLHVIRWDCSRAGRRSGTRTCVRQDVTANTTRNVWVDVRNTDVFTQAADSRHIRIRIEQDNASGGAPFVLEGGVTARSCAEGEGVVGEC